MSADCDEALLIAAQGHATRVSPLWAILPGHGSQAMRHDVSTSSTPMQHDRPGVVSRAGHAHPQRSPSGPSTAAPCFRGQYCGAHPFQPLSSGKPGRLPMPVWHLAILVLLIMVQFQRHVSGCVGDRDIYVHADRKAPRCLPCGYEDPLMGKPWEKTVPQPSFNATPVSSS